MTLPALPTWATSVPLATVGRIPLLGSGNHALDISMIAHRAGFDVQVFDDDPATGFPPLPPNQRYAIIAINDSLTRAACAERLNIAGWDPLIDPSAIVGSHCSIGVGVVIAPQTLLMHEVELGCHVHINYHVSTTRCKVGPFSTISPGATICGNVEIGECTMIGAGATICERTTIGDNVKVGAGAVVPPHSIVPNGVTVKGVWKNA